MTASLKEKPASHQEVEFFWRVSKTIASNAILKDILHLIVTLTAELMNSKICSITLLDEKRQELVLAATQSLSPDYIKKHNVRVGESVSGRAVKEKRPITVLDVRQDHTYRFPEIAKKEGIVSMLSVPMMIQDRVVGVINSYTTHEYAFTEFETKILQAVANQAAVAIDNTRLREEARSAREALEVRKLVERAKAVLMEDNHISDQEAYYLLHKKSRDTRKPAREIAEAILLAHEMRV